MFGQTTKITRKMRIYNDRFLRALAKRAQRPYAEVGSIISNYLVEVGAIYCPEYYLNCKVKESIAENTPFLSVAGVFEKIGINKPTCEDFANLMHCTIMGDGECPECGGDCEVIDGEYTSRQAYRDTEPEITTKWELCKCSYCGYKFYK